MNGDLLQPAGDLLTNLAAAAIGGAAVWLMGRLREWIRVRRARRFWKFATESAPVVVIGTQDQKALKGWEHSGLVGLGDIDALLSIQTYFRDLGISAPIGAAQNLPTEDWRKNLVLIGGPDANSLTSAIIRRIEDSLSFIFPLWQLHVVNIIDKLGRHTIVPEHGPGGELTSDFGVIVYAANPLASNSNVLIVAGCWGYGSAAAAEMLSDKAFLRHPVCSSGKPFEALVQTTVAGGRHHQPRLVDARLLSDFVSEKAAYIVAGRTARQDDQQS